AVPSRSFKRDGGSMPGDCNPAPLPSPLPGAAFRRLRRRGERETETGVDEENEPRTALVDSYAKMRGARVRPYQKFFFCWRFLAKRGKDVYTKAFDVFSEENGALWHFLRYKFADVISRNRPLLIGTRTAPGTRCGTRTRRPGLGIRNGCAV